MVSAENKHVTQKRWVTLIRFAALVFLAVGFLVWLNYGWILSIERQMGAFAHHTLGDDLERQSRKLSGSHSTDCGRVGNRGDATTANECALRAFRTGKPFRVRYDLHGFDSDASVGLVYTPEGKLYSLSFDGDPSGQGGTSWSRQRVGKTACSEPFQMRINRDGHLSCK